MRYYIATGLENAAEAVALHRVLREHGWKCTYDWTVHGSAPERVEEISDLEIGGVISASVLFVILPGGKGTHAELGAALGKMRIDEARGFNSDMRVVIFGDKPEVQFEKVFGTCCFYWHYGVTRVDKSDLDEFMRQLLNAHSYREFLLNTRRFVA